jgi:hypothetical protein
MWAARADNQFAIKGLVARGADVWPRGSAYQDKDAWSALRLLNLAGNTYPGPQVYLRPGEGHRTRPKPISRGDGEKDSQIEEEEEWDDASHECKQGYRSGETCRSCLVTILGSQWTCLECNNFSLCFKCYGHQSEYHPPTHTFTETAPMYDDDDVRRSAFGSGNDESKNGSVDGGSGEEAQAEDYLSDDLEFIMDETQDSPAGSAELG